MNLRKDHYRFDLNDHTENSCEGLGVVLIFLKKNREDAERRDPKFSRPSYFFFLHYRTKVSEKLLCNNKNVT